MKVGAFTINEYLEKLNEEAEAKEAKETKEAKMSVNKDGLIIPDTNKKTYDWLKSEYNKAQTEVKVEMTSAKFAPGYSFQGAKDFKPEMNTAKGTSSLPKQNPLPTAKSEKQQKPSGNPFAAKKVGDSKPAGKAVSAKKVEKEEDTEEKEDKKPDFLKKK